ncbi:MAG: hypothetical protein ACPGVG_03870 [Mycobacterium sp.]
MSGVVLVAGPPSAGVTSLIEQLRRRIPGHSFLEARDVDASVVPAAVVFVVSAVAPVTASDCALADRVAARSDVVVAAVSKVDDHRDWRGVLALNRERLAACAERFRQVPWVAAAAAPRLGEPRVDDLVDLVKRALRAPESARRNSLRSSEFRLCAEISRVDAEAASAGRRSQVAALRERREGLMGQRLLAGAEASIALRSRIQQARVRLMFSVRSRCAIGRTELLDMVAGGTRWRPFTDVEECVRRRCRGILADVDDQITAHVKAVAADLRVAEPPRPPSDEMVRFADPRARSGRLDTQLMAVLGTGFGLGVTLLVSRLFAGLAPEATVAGLVAGGVVGLAITVWVVRSRGLLQYRAVLERWVNEVIGTVRDRAEERVASRMLVAETALLSAYLARADAQRRATGRCIAEIDAEIREHTCAIARAEAHRKNEMPSLLRSLRTVRDELAEQNPADPLVTDQ